MVYTIDTVDSDKYKRQRMEAMGLDKEQIEILEKMQRTAEALEYWQGVAEAIKNSNGTRTEYLNAKKQVEYCKKRLFKK